MRQVTCPQCERVLWIPEEVPVFGWVCSDCRVLANDPGTTEESEPCPRCGKAVRAVFRFCPHCEAVLQGADRGSQGGKLDDLVHRQGGRFHNSVGLFTIAGILGLALICPMAIGSFQSSKGVSLLLLLGGIVLLGAASTGIMFYRTRDNPGKRGIGQVVVGTLALAGALVTFSCALGASIGLFFFVSCLMGY